MLLVLFLGEYKVSCKCGNFGLEVLWKHTSICIPQVKGILQKIGCSYTKIGDCKKPIRNIPNIS